jgi:hypothetical protein
LTPSIVVSLLHVWAGIPFRKGANCDVRVIADGQTPAMASTVSHLGPTWAGRPGPVSAARGSGSTTG